MASEMMEALMLLCQEKHIDELYLLDRLEQSLAKSYADVLHLDFGAKVTIDRTTGRIYVYKLVPKDDSMDEEGNYTEFDEVDVTPKDTSRIAAQHAKAEINAIVRNAAREQIYQEFSQRIGDIITGTVLQSTPDFTIVKIREGVEAELPHFDLKRHPEELNERPAGERYSHNQRIKAIIIDVRD
ncbi:NusA N-terminal domain-containing protein, partial [uncultured Parolsenella sp.]|uniref:NusA N-terminal domain-containing protein n=1 Tax=uncultured Parolsenella sp. TaxID=2083008 RepID=UPI0027D9B704